jgi:hypothetical protein
MDVSGIISPANLTEITGIIEDYSENMRYYNRNIRDLIGIYRDLIPQSSRQINGSTEAMDHIRTVSTIIEYLNEINDSNIILPPVTIPTNTSITAPSTSTTTVPRVNSVSNNPYRGNYLRNRTVDDTTVPRVNRVSNSPYRGNRYQYGTNDTSVYPIIYNDPIRLNRNRFQWRDFNNLQNVIVRPTNEQIRSATQVLEFHDSSFSQVQCPISLAPFETGQEIRMINHCGHIFDNISLIEWFDSSVRCPVCRHDIRDVSGSTSSQTDSSRNTVIPIPPNTVDYNSDSDESSEEDDSESVNVERLQRENSENNNANTDNMTNYVREILDTITNHNTVPHINDTVNSLFSTYNIPVVIDISYTTFI